MESTWEWRELPVLSAAVQHFEDLEALWLNVDQLAELTGLDREDVKRAMRWLSEADPPYVRGETDFAASHPSTLSGVTERARRATDQWPTPESLGDRIVAALNEAAEQTDDPEEKSKLRRLADFAGGVGKGALTGALTKMLTEGM